MSLTIASLPKADEALVEMFQTLLEMAKRGEIRQIICVGECTAGNEMVVFRYLRKHSLSMIGAMTMELHVLTRDRAEGA
jgi:hypothetical protein